MDAQLQHAIGLGALTVEIDAQGSARVRPLHDNVLIDVDDRVETLPNGLLVPWIAQKLPNTGVIVGVGSSPKCSQVPPVGTRVVFEKHAHADREWVQLGGRKHVWCRAHQVIGVVEDAPPDRVRQLEHAVADAFAGSMIGDPLFGVLPGKEQER